LIVAVDEEREVYKKQPNTRDELLARISDAATGK